MPCFGEPRATGDFATYHPALQLGFFIVAILLAILVAQPLWQLVGLVAAFALLLCVRKRGEGATSLKALLWIVPLCVAIAVVNPLLNTQGDTVLFTWLADRPYTLEALAYGASTALMVATVILWFLSFNIVMTSERLTYLFGGVAPAFTLVFTMTLRLLPRYGRKAHEVETARSGIGRSARWGSLKARTESGAALLTALTGQALEGSITTADSMRSRGYGTGKRTSFSSYGLTWRDGVFTVVELGLLAVTVVALIAGDATTEYFPALLVQPVTALGILGLVCFTFFLMLPTLVHWGEVVRWHLLLSRI